MQNYTQNKNKGLKGQNNKKYRQKSRKEAPKILFLPPICLAIVYVYFMRTTQLETSLIRAAIFIVISYVVITIAWAIHYKRMLGGASLKQIDVMTGEEFEDYLAVLYKKKMKNGQPMFTSVSTTPKTCDYGADLLLRSADGKKIVIQAKRYRKKVPESAVQQLISAREFYQCDIGMVVTNSMYTDAAKTLAKKTNVILIDRYKLGTEAMFRF